MRTGAWAKDGPIRRLPSRNEAISQVARQDECPIEAQDDDNRRAGSSGRSSEPSAGFEKRVIVLKLRAARERKRARGERLKGLKRYGHFPAEQKPIEHMRQRRRKPRKGRRLSVAALAVQLNAEGHQNRAGREGSPQMVHRSHLSTTYQHELIAKYGSFILLRESAP
jgi:hypothetical protein